MDKKEMIFIASVAIDKQLDYETLMYSDYLYGNEDFIDDVWGYVSECIEIGTIAFKEKYKNFNLCF